MRDSKLTLTAVLILLCGVQAAEENERMPPLIQQENESSLHILANTDAEVTLTCRATGSPTIRYSWMLNDKDLDQRGNIAIDEGDEEKPATLTILYFTSLDEGYYQCRASNNYGTSLSNVFYVQRAVLGRVPPHDPIEYSVAEGQPLKLVCGGPPSIPAPTYSWISAENMDDQSPIPVMTGPRISIDDHGNLYFSHITKDDGSRVKPIYQCTVFNHYLDLTSSGSASVITVSEGSLSPKSPELLYSSDTPYLAIKGQTIRLQCIFSGIPEVEVQWDPMPAGRSDTAMHGTVLEIMDVRFSDAKSYTCTGSNSEGSASKQLINVQVHAIPEFLAKPTNINGTEGLAVTFHCEATAETNPEARVQWLNNGEPLYNRPRTEISGDGLRLTINNLCLRDCEGGVADSMVVQCNISNAHGYAFAEAYLRVLEKTVLTVLPENQHLDENNTVVTLRCEAKSDASTPVEISWEKPMGHALLNDLRYEVGKNSLTINLDGLDLESDEAHGYAGWYVCAANNGYSSERATAEVMVGDCDDSVTTEAPGSGQVKTIPGWTIASCVCIVALIAIKM